MAKRWGHHALVVDWDFFFPINPMWDWALSELWNPMMANALWLSRAGAFEEARLPRPVSNWRRFWDRFGFSDDCYAEVADSNRLAHHALMERFDGDLSDVRVWLFDQHHDAGYKGTLESNLERDPTCENWMLHVGVQAELPGTNLRVVYPTHRALAFKQEPVPLLPVHRVFDHHHAPPKTPAIFDYVFVCRSGSWVPPWCDEDFWTFLDDCPVPIVSFYDDLDRREFTYPSDLRSLFRDAEGRLSRTTVTMDQDLYQRVKRGEL